MNLYASITWMFIGSIFIGYLLVSSLLVNTFENIENSLTKLYIALYMALWMVGLEILMYYFYNGGAYIILLLLTTFIFIIVVYYLARSQIGIDDDQYMKAMIQHHSTAILTSNEILKKSRNPAVISLAEQIIISQEAEINLMNSLLDR